MSTRRKGDFAYTKDDYVFVPEVRIRTHNPAYRYEALRGYSYTVAVFDGDTCIGYAVKGKDTP